MFRQNLSAAAEAAYLDETSFSGLAVFNMDLNLDDATPSGSASPEESVSYNETPFVSAKVSESSSPVVCSRPNEAAIFSPSSPDMDDEVRDRLYILQKTLDASSRLFFTLPKCMQQLQELEYGALESSDDQPSTSPENVNAAEDELKQTASLNAPLARKKTEKVQAEKATKESFWARLSMIGSALSRDPATCYAGTVAATKAYKR